MSEGHLEPETFEWGSHWFGWGWAFLAAFVKADRFHKFDGSDLTALAQVAAEAVAEVQVQACDASLMPRPGVGKVSCQLLAGHPGPHRGMR